MGAFPLPPTYPVDVRAATGGGVTVRRVGTALELAIDPTGLPTSEGVVTGYAAAVCSGHRVLRSTPTGLMHASASDVTQFGSVVGVSLTAALVGAQITYRETGPIDETSWTWTPGQPVYLVEDGQLSQTEPPTGFIQPLGTAVTATRILLGRFPPVLL